MNLVNKLALVTGGASGMGAACVQALRKKNVRVVIWDKQILPEDANAIHCDISLAPDVERAMQETISRFGIPNICIQSAGIAPAKRIIGKGGPMFLDDFKHVIDINLIGTFNVMRIVAHAMSTLPLSPNEEERGVIINTASIAAYEGQIGQTAYSASKGGVVSMTLPAARELATHAIRVNTIAPGVISTPMVLSFSEEIQQNLAATIPFPQRLGQPEEFAALAMHIIENSYINGTIIRLDGALRMQAR